MPRFKKYLQMEMVLLGFTVLIIFVKAVVAATKENECRKRFRRDFSKFMEGNWGGGADDYVTRERLYRDYKRQGY